METHKGPESDGFPLLLSKILTHRGGDQIIRAVHQIFFVGRLTPIINETIICLIPKGNDLESLNQFRLISLCNVLKIISKILANRLKPLMPKLTHMYQSSFIPGRSTTDNIMLTQEVLPSLNRQKASKGGFILKVDLKKAYDQVGLC